MLNPVKALVMKGEKKPKLTNCPIRKVLASQVFAVYTYLFLSQHS